MSNGRSFTGTPEHRVWIASRGWTKIEDLLRSDELLPAEPTDTPVTCVGLTVEQPVPVYNLAVADAPELLLPPHAANSVATTTSMPIAAGVLNSID